MKYLIITGVIAITLAACATPGTTGTASLTTPDGGTYQGTVEDGVMHGEGRLEWPSGAFYEGEFHQGLKHGEGTGHYVDGRIYIGEYQEGQWSTGLLHSPDGHSYQGEFKKRQYHGSGLLTYGNGNQYEGAFRAGRFHGAGVFALKNGTFYEGEFERGELHQGVIQFANGSRYEGQIQQWRPHGEGSMTSAAGDTRSGSFDYGRFVDKDTRAARQVEQRLKSRYLEAAIYRQDELLKQQTDGLVDQSDGRVEVYGILAALSSDETVFRSEVERVKALLNEYQQFQGRLITLANEVTADDNHPLATTTSLGRMIDHLGQRLGSEDLLMVYLTTHGSPDHELSVTVNNQPFPSLSPQELKKLLARAPQQKVVVLSACFSGGFIPELSDADTLVITAAAKDKASFGCSNEETMTYFGRAFFETAFSLDQPLDTVFERARQAVMDRESSEDHTPSNPQMAGAPAVQNAWNEWRRVPSPPQ